MCMLFSVFLHVESKDFSFAILLDRVVGFSHCLLSVKWTESQQQQRMESGRDCHNSAIFAAAEMGSVVPYSTSQKGLGSLL